VVLVHPGTGEVLGWWAARKERGHRRNGARIVEHAQRFCDEPLQHGALLTRQGQRTGQPWGSHPGDAVSAAGLPSWTILAIGPTLIWAMVGGRAHPDRAEEVLAVWPRARVSLGEAEGKERVLGVIPVRLVELGLPNGDRAWMRPYTLSLEAAHALGTEPTAPAYLVDDGGLERVEPDGRGFRLTWDSLRQVTLVRPSAQGWEAVHFVGDDGELVVPFGAVREAMWDRVRRLPGTNAALVESAVLSTGSTDRQLWWQGMDTDPDFIP
jgi:hypothetical protein